nr:PREDICTED: uncharacterized protein LOC109032374 [Bemisia tabaci]
MQTLVLTANKLCFLFQLQRIGRRVRTRIDQRRQITVHPAEEQGNIFANREGQLNYVRSAQGDNCRHLGAYNNGRQLARANNVCSSAMEAFNLLQLPDYPHFEAARCTPDQRWCIFGRPMFTRSYVCTFYCNPMPGRPQVLIDGQLMSPYLLTELVIPAE